LCANPRYMDFLRGRCDVLCVGHSHLHMDEKIEGIQVYQSGSDYDRSRYILFDA
jgi:predicted phosphodiesterase